MKLRSSPFAAISIALISATTLHATTLYWDGTDTTAAVADANGGAGTWDTTLTNWNDAAIAGSAVVWPSSGTDNNGVFGTPAGLVTIDAGGVSANDLTFGLTGYTVAGGTLTLNGTTNILTSTVPAAASSAVNLTISAALAGTTGFTKAGLGHVYLSGDNTSLTGALTINTAASTQTSGVTLSGANAPGGLTQINVNGGGVSADGSFLSLENTTLASGLTVNLTGQGGTGTIGTLRSSVGDNTVNGPVNINSALVRISNYVGTSLTLNGVVTGAANNCYIRFGQTKGVIFTNSANSWSGVTNLGEGSVYFYPGTLPATSSLTVGSSGPADYGTNDSFTRALGTTAGQVQFGKGNDGQRAMGFSARGGALNVNLGGAGADLVCLNTFAKTGAIASTTATVTVTDATNIVIGMSVTGTGIPADTLINAVAGTTVTLSKNATATNAAAALTFYAAADSARFNSSVLVLNGANADSALTLQNPVDLNGFNRFLQVSADTATLTGGLKNSSGTAAAARKTGAGTLIHDPGTGHTVTLAGLNTNAGTLELKSGTITVSGSVATGASESATGFTVARGGTFRLNGGNIIATSGTYIFPAGNTNGGNSKFILDSGTFNANGREVLNAYGAAGTTTINGGLFICNGFKVTQNTGILNLNGGTLRANRLYGDTNSSTVNFNGGILQAKVAIADFVATTVTTAQIQADGAVIDSNGFAITIPKSLTEDPGSTGGGLTKMGAGTLTLTAVNSYTGPTAVTVGTLALVGGSQTSPITVDSGATLGFTLGSPTTSISSVTFSGANAKVSVSGTPVAATLMTTTVSGGITGTPVLDPAILGFALQITATELKLVASSTPYDTWMTLYPSITGSDKLPTADPDNDGLVNQQEFAYGLIPNNGASVNPILFQLDKTTGTFTYQRRAATGLSYRILTSTTLAGGSWTEDVTATTGQVATSIGGGNESVVVTLTGPKPLGDTKLFVRVAAQ